MASFVLSAFADEADAALAGQAAAVLSNGIHQIEMRGVNGKSVAGLTDREALEAKALLDAQGIGISSMGSPFGKYPVDQPFAPQLVAFERGLKLCQLLGAKRMRVFSFFIPEGQDASEYRGEVLHRLSRMLDLAEKAGVSLAHENEKGIYGDTDGRCLDLMEQFGDRMGFIFDPANFIQCGVEPWEAFEKLRKYIAYVHVKDAIRGEGAVVPAGMGDGNLPRILSVLALGADDMVLSVEPHLKVFSGLSSLQSEELKHRYHYPDKLAAFGAAVSALKELLRKLNFVEGGNGIWTR